MRPGGRWALPTRSSGSQSVLKTPTIFLKTSTVVSTESKRKAARVPHPTMGRGKARPLGRVPIFMYRDAILQFGTHVIGLAKPAHPHRGKTRYAGPVSRPREGADAHGHPHHGSNRRPLLRWHSRCVRVLSVPRESPQGRARAKLNSPPVVPLASRQRPRRSHGPPRPWYFTHQTLSLTCRAPASCRPPFLGRGR